MKDPLMHLSWIYTCKTYIQSILSLDSISPPVKFYCQLVWYIVCIIIALLFSQKGVQFVYQGF